MFFLSLFWFRYMVMGIVYLEFFFFVFGYEDNFKEMRVWIVFEFVLNLKCYMNENIFVIMFINKSLF